MVKNSSVKNYFQSTVFKCDSQITIIKCHINL